MTVKKAPEERKPRGGARIGAGRKPKLATQEAQMEWTAQLQRVITAASSNMGCVQRHSFWTLREIKQRWGIRVVEEFKEWFEAAKHLDQAMADRLLQERLSGALTEERYNELLYTQAFSWIWSLRSEKQRTAWELTRGLRTLH